MKKIVLIISVIITLFGVIVTVFPLLIKASGLDEPLKAYLLPKIMDENQGRLDFADYTIGLGRINFIDVVVASDDSNYELKIKSLKISLNLLKLIRYPSEPQRAISDVSIIEPEFVIKKKMAGQISEPMENTEGKINISIFADILNQIQTISEISIKDGKVFFQDTKNKGHLLANKLSGSLTSDKLSNLTVELHGNLFNGIKQNLFTKTRLNIKDRDFRAQVKISHHYRYEDSYSFLSSDVQALEGDVNGNLVLSNKGLNIDSLLVYGLVTAENIRAVVDSNTIEQLGFRLNFKGMEVFLEEGDGKYNGHPFYFSGHADQFFNPSVTAQGGSKDLPLKVLDHYLPSNADPEDKIDLDMDFALENLEPVIVFNISADSINTFKPASVSAMSAQISWQPEGIQLEHLNGMVGEVALLAAGKYDIDSKALSVNISGSHTFGIHTIFDKLSGQDQLLTLNLVHNFSNAKTSGKWHYLISDASDTTLTVDGSLYGGDEKLSVLIDTSNVSGLQGQIHLNQLSSSLQLGNSKIVNLPITHFITDQTLRQPIENFNSVIELEGELQALKGRILLTEKNNPQSQYLLSAEIIDLFSSRKQVKGNVKIRNMLAYYDFVILADSLGGYIASPDGIDGKISLDLADNEKLNGYLRFNSFNVLQSFRGDSVESDDFKLQGTVNGDIVVDGTLRSPRVKMQMQGDKFVYNSVGYYQVALTARIDKESCTFDSLNVYLNNLPLLSGSATWTLEDGALDGFIEGRGIDVVNLMTTINPENVFMTGSADFKVDLRGSIEYPWFEATAKIQNGSIGNIEFDDMDLSFFDEVNAQTSIFSLNSHTMQVNDFSMSKKGLYHFTADGRIPLSQKEPLDVHIDFDGDLLSFLPKVERFFLNGASLASAHIGIGGTFDNIYLTEGEINLERGELWLRDVARHIENIEGKIYLAEGTNQVNFENFVARVDDQMLQINTVRDISLQSGMDLEHWYFKGLDLDFGILSLVTSAEGIELNIPGLMAREDAGKLHLGGRAEGENFYFAGPVRNPVVYGNLTLYDTRMTYPFLTNTQPGKKESIAVRFLKNLEWDIIATSGEDVKYHREIPAYIDNVHTELFVDESSEGLHFTGIINRGTFRANGSLISTRGRLEYLDQNFKVDRFAIEFTRSEELPIISGKAWTAIRDSIGAAPKTIYLQLYAIDQETGAERQQGGWEDFNFKLVSADPEIGETQKMVLAHMGYSADNIKEKATSVGGAVTEKYLIRPLLRPVERALEDNLGMDMVRINSSIAKNLFYSSFGASNPDDPMQQALNPFSTSSSYLMLMQSSEVTVGKYLAQNVFLTYTGQLVGVQRSADIDFGFNHSFGIEYRFFRNVLLEFEYDRELSNMYRYTNQNQYMDDFKIRLRHSFTF